MKPKTYSINSLQDIADAITHENVDNFINDFGGVLKAYLILVDLAREKVPKFAKKGKNTNLVLFEGLHWTDDGKHNITCEISKKDG